MKEEHTLANNKRKSKHAEQQEKKDTNINER